MAGPDRVPAGTGPEESGLGVGGGGEEPSSRPRDILSLCFMPTCQWGRGWGIPMEGKPKGRGQRLCGQARVSSWFADTRGTSHLEKTTQRPECRPTERGQLLWPRLLSHGQGAGGGGAQPRGGPGGSAGLQVPPSSTSLRQPNSPGCWRLLESTLMTQCGSGSAPGLQTTGGWWEGFPRSPQSTKAL